MQSRDILCLNPQDLVTGVWWREVRAWRSGGGFPGLWPGSLCEWWYDVEHGERSRCRVDDAAHLGCVCGTTGKVFCPEMGLQVRWFHETEVVAEYLGGSLVLRCGSIGVHSQIVGQRRASWPRQPSSAVLLRWESLLLSVSQCPG